MTRLFAGLFILMTLTAAFLAAAHSPQAGRGYRYFFWASTDRTLVVIGVNRSTYRLYNLAKGGMEKSLAFEDTVERMQMKIHRVIRPGYYVLESDSRLTVIVCSDIGEDATIYFTSTEGNYVGREFIFTPRAPRISHRPP